VAANGVVPDPDVFRVGEHVRHVITATASQSLHRQLE